MQALKFKFSPCTEYWILAAFGKDWADELGRGDSLFETPQGCSACWTKTEKLPRSHGAPWDDNDDDEQGRSESFWWFVFSTAAMKPHEAHVIRPWPYAAV